MNEYAIGIIPARFKSSRFPGKLLASLGGKPVLEHTLSKALSSKALKEVFVATDDAKIFDFVKSVGGKALMTSLDIKTGTDRVIEAFEKYPELQKADFVINIQGDHPFISPDTIAQVVRKLKDDKDAQVATAAIPLKDLEKAKSPHVVKCVMDVHGNALYFSRAMIPYGKNPTIHHHIGIYGFRRQFLNVIKTLPYTDLDQTEDLEQLRFLAHGYKIKVAIVEDTAQGVDTPEDLLMCEKLLCQLNTSL